jgi:hypothetical protein
VLFFNFLLPCILSGKVAEGKRCRRTTEGEFLQEDSIPESGTDFGMGSPDASRKATKFNFNFEDEDGMNTNATNSTYGDPSGVLENSQNSSTNQKKDRLKNSAPSGMNQRAK